MYGGKINMHEIEVLSENVINGYMLHESVYEIYEVGKIQRQKSRWTVTFRGKGVQDNENTVMNDYGFF